VPNGRATRVLNHPPTSERPILIFYADEFGDTSLALDPASSKPALKPGTSEYFILAAVGVRDVSRAPLAQALTALKKTHFGSDVFDRDWSTSEIKGSLLNHAMVHARQGRVVAAPSAYRVLDTVAKTEAFIADVGLLFTTYRPIILVQVIDKKTMLARDTGLTPLGVAYAYLHQRIARVVEQQFSGETAMIVADEQKEHEKQFTTGALHRAREAVTTLWTHQPNFNLVMDKPLWIDPKLSSWDREIIQLADIVAFTASKVMGSGTAPVERQFLWNEIRASLSVKVSTGGRVYDGFGIYPAPKKKDLPVI